MGRHPADKWARPAVQPYLSMARPSGRKRAGRSHFIGRQPDRRQPDLPSDWPWTHHCMSCPWAAIRRTSGRARRSSPTFRWPAHPGGSAPGAHALPGRDRPPGGPTSSGDSPTGASRIISSAWPWTHHCMTGPWTAHPGGSVGGPGGPALPFDEPSIRRTSGRAGRSHFIGRQPDRRQPAWGGTARVALA
jgi:hypothetical protein